MDNKRRGLFILLAVVLIIAGTVGGYLTGNFLVTLRVSPRKLRRSMPMVLKNRYPFPITAIRR